MGAIAGAKVSHVEPRGASVCLRPAELCGLGGSVMDLLDCAEDHRRGVPDADLLTLDSLGRSAVMYLGEPPFGRHGLAIRAGGGVCRRTEHAGQDLRSRVKLGFLDIGESASPASMRAQGWWATSGHNMASACWASRRYRAPWS